MLRGGLVYLSILISALAAQEPASLQVRVVDGEGVIYPVGSRATRGVAIQVTDQTNRPVEGATVSFRLPEDGPGGTFATGAKTEIATTGADGRAGVWGMRWNRDPGSFEIRITAVKGTARAGTLCPQSLTNSLAARAAVSPVVRIRGGHGHKWLWITFAVAGAAASGVTATALTGHGSATAAATPVAVQIGAPTIILGHP